MDTVEGRILQLIGNPQRQREGFSLLVKEFAPQLYQQIRRIVVTHEDANDVLQNALIKIWQGLPSFEGRSRLSSWLCRIAINEALTFVRANRRLADISADIGDDEQNVAQRLHADPYFDGDDASVRLEACIRSLPHVQQMVFRMRYFDDMSYAEISEVLGTSEGALKASYHIAMKKIEDLLRSENG